MLSIAKECYPISEQLPEQEDGSRTRLSMEAFRKRIGISSTVKLYGREREEAFLLEAYRRFRNERKPKLVVVTGVSGSGKTTLIENCLRAAVTKDNGFFITGRIQDQQGYAVPYYDVFIRALTEYVEQFLRAADTELLASTRKRLLEEAGTEARLLTEKVPALNRIMGEIQHEPTKVYGLDAQNQIRYLFCQCFKVLSSVAPLVLFLDDTQWASTSCCDLIRSMLITEGISILIVGGHMSPSEQEVSRKQMEPLDEREGETSFVCMTMMPFESTIESLEREGIPIDKITVPGLDIDSLSDLVKDLLCRPEEDVQPLVRMLLAQTQGIVFHVLQLLRLHIDRQIIYKNVDSDGWEWDTEASAENSSLDDIMRHLCQKMGELPHVTQAVLKIASCMGDEIDDSAVDIILQTPCGWHLKHAADKGLLQFFPEYGGYRFAHYWIRHSAFELIPKEERDEFFLKIGRKLWVSSNPVLLKKNVSTVVSLLNKGAKLIKEERERVKVAELNLMAGEKSSAEAAFGSASRFFRKGIELLGSGDRIWRDYYSLALALYSGAAEVEAVNGNYDDVVLYIESVIKYGHSVADKLRAYAAFMQSMGEQDNLSEATKVGCNIMGQIGEKIPYKNPSKLFLTKEIMMTKFALRNKTNADIFQLPRIRDSVTVETLRLLSLIFAACHKSHNPAMLVVACRMIRLIISDGLDDCASLAFAHYAQVMCGIGDVDAGTRYGALALSLAEQMQSKLYTPKIHLILGLSVNHWQNDVESVIESLRYASRAAMEIGDIETSSVATAWRCAIATTSGEDCLEDLEKDMCRCVSIVYQYHKNSTAIFCLEVQQYIQCLRGKAENPARLSGKALDFDKMQEECIATSNILWLRALHLFAAKLSYDFRDYQHAANILKKASRTNTFSQRTLFVIKEIAYFRGLLLVQMARLDDDSRKHVKEARAILKESTSWSESNATLTCNTLLLEAELETLKDRSHGPQLEENIVAMYNAAFEAAREVNNFRIQGFVAERLADYLCSLGVTGRALGMYQRAAAAFQTWGATAKVDQLQEIIDSMMANGILDS